MRLHLRRTRVLNLGPGANVSGLSANGSVAAGYITGGQFFHWTPARGVVFVGGNGPGGGIGGSAVLSDDGTRFSGNSTNPVTNLSEMSYYSIPAGTWTRLGTIGGSSGNEASSGWGMSGNGQSVVGLGWVNAGTAHAIQWKQGGSTQDLCSTVAGMSSRANATNFDGSVVGGWQDDSTGFRQAAIWQNGVQSLITRLAQPVSEVLDVNAAGTYAVGYGGFATDSLPWRYNTTTGQIELLGTIDPFNSDRGATGVSDDGKTVVGFDRGFPPFAGKGTIWFEGIGIQNLTTFATSIGVPIPAGVTLTLPLAISADGLTISGFDNSFNGFVISIPEPASAGLAGFALSIVLMRRRAAR